MRLLFTLLIFFIAANSIFAQKEYTPVTAIYKISDKEAKELYLNESDTIADRYFHTFVDTVSKTYNYPQPEIGYYLFAKANQEELSVEMEGTHSISAVSVVNERDLSIQVIDSLGQMIEDAKVMLQRKDKLEKIKLIPFDKKTKTYRLKKKHRDGFITIEARGETIFYNLKNGEYQSLREKRWRRFATTRVGHIVTTPWRLGKRIFHFFKRGIEYSDWQIYNKPFRKKYKPQKPYKGYIALNQPKFQPNDTVKVSAYFTNHKGKPLNDEVVIKLLENRRRGNPIFQKSIQPTTKGAYNYEFVLGDSLKLDKTYSLFFFQKDKEIMSHSFRYEDYLLDEIDYTFETTQKEYYKNEKVIFLAEGKDKNDWTIPDGNIRIIATRGRISEFYEKEMLIPDTLWVHTQQLDVGGQTQFFFPKEKLPNADMRINVKAYLSNSSGELHTKNLNFNYDALEEKYDLKLEDGYLIVTSTEKGKSVEKEVLLSGYGEADNLEFEKKIKVPYKERISPFITDYDIYTANENVFDINLRSMPSQVNAVGTRTRDSISVVIQNPNRIPVTYQIRTKNKLFYEGQTDSSFFDLKIKNGGGKHCFFYYQYFWAGQKVNNRADVIFYKNLLAFDIIQPKTVEPGEQAQIKVKVKTAKNKPASNVNLTAGAINAQFDQLHNIKHPTITYKKSRTPLKFNHFQLKEINNLKKKTDITKKWVDLLNLKKNFFYELRHSEEEVFMHYDTITRDTFYQHLAQFAPYLFQNGKTKPIYMIYCNRQLVYYHDVDDNPPYSFIGREGLNQIVIRTREHTYTLNNILLKKGQKLELAIHLDNFGNSDFGKNITRRATTTYLTEQEKALLRKQIFIIRKYNQNKSNYVWQQNNIHKLPYGYNYNWKSNGVKLGPFYANNDLKILETNGWNSTFRFESGFTYEVEKGRERLYQTDLFLSKNKYHLYYKNAIKLPKQVVYVPSDIIVKTEQKENIAAYFKRTNPNISNSGTYQFDYKQNPSKSDSALYAIVLLYNDTTFTIYSSGVRTIYNLPERNYQLFLFTKTGNYIQREIQIRKDTLLYQDLREEDFTIDSIYFQNILTEFKNNIEKKKGNKSPVISHQEIKKNTPAFGNSMIQGKVIEQEDNEELIGANIVVYKNGIVVTGTTTDIDGNYRVFLDAGIYKVEVNYTGYYSKEITNVIVRDGLTTTLDFQMEGGVILNEVVVTGYGIQKEKKALGYATTTVTSNDIENMPKRNVNAIAAQTAGITSEPLGKVAGVQLYGNRAAATDYYIDGQRVAGGVLEDIELLQLRSNFSDYAYFQPNLITDKNGEAYFTITYPDNITSWKTFVVGMNHRQQGGTHFGQVKAFKKLSAQLALPRFMVEGDETNIIGKSINYTADSYNIQTTFKLNDQIIKTNAAEIKEALIENVSITATENVDSLTMSYQLNMENYGDGEEKQIPVFRRGIEEMQGVFYVLENDTSLQIDFNNPLGDVKIHIEDNLLKVLLEDLKYLKKYPYGCNEQTASRLIALLLEKEVKSILGEKFEDEKLIIKMIQRLKKTQNPDGSWGWWSGGYRNYWMTTYVLNALNEAQKANYKTEAFNKGLIYLTNELSSLEGKELLNALMLFSDIEQNLDYKKYTAPLDTMKLSLHDKLALIKIQQANDLEYSLDTLSKYKVETLFGAWHWGEENYRWYDNSFQISLLAYQIYQRANKTNEAKKVRQYFLEKRKRNGWRNTIETARILAAILPDLMKEMNGSLDAKVVLSGDVNQTINTFPFDGKFSAGQKINIQKQSGGVVFFSAYQEFWNTKPEKKEDLYEIKTKLLQNGNTTQNIKTAEPLDLVVDVVAKKSGEYLMLEIPIPAGCSYRSKVNYRKGYESHREYFKEKVSVFFEDLPKGKHQIRIQLEPRFEGKYTLNPTKMEQMYFPVFYGRNELEEVEIK